MKKKAHGFTIVELLIVIVVIAILAAITIVSYTGMQVRARDAGRLTLIKSIEKALEMYRATEGHYPPIQNGHSGEGLCGSPTKNWGHCDRLKELQDKLAPYATLDIISLSNKKFVPQDLSDGEVNFLYATTWVDNRQSYGMAIRMEGDLGKTDNGVFDQYYEVGNKVEYCKNKYTSAPAADWIKWDTMCGGGN